MGLRFLAELNVGLEFFLRLWSDGFGRARRYSSLFLFARLETGQEYFKPRIIAFPV